MTEENQVLYIIVTENGNIVFEKSFSSLPITIGRNLDCDVSLPQYKQLSRQHVMVAKDGDNFCVVDLKSSNGFKVDGKRQQRQAFTDLQTINLGQIDVTIKAVEDWKNLGAPNN